jgi:hypothetical protein
MATATRPPFYQRADARTKQEIQVVELEEMDRDRTGQRQSTLALDSDTHRVTALA